MWVRLNLRTARSARGVARNRRIEAELRTFTPKVSAFHREWLTFSGFATHCSRRAWSRYSGSGDPSVVKSDRWRMNLARMPSPSARSVNSSIQLALTRTSGLSEVEGRQETDQYQRSVLRGMGMQVSP